MLILTNNSYFFKLNKLLYDITIYLFIILRFPIFKIILLNKPKVMTSGINFIDKNSMGIYVPHHILKWLILIYIHNMKELMISSYIIMPIILFICVFLVSLGISWF